MTTATAGDPGVLDVHIQIQQPDTAGGPTIASYHNGTDIHTVDLAAVDAAWMAALHAALERVENLFLVV